MTTPEAIRTRVGIVGGGPAGLMLSHLLAGAGIDNVVVENRDHETIRTSHRAGILEHGSVDMLVGSGVSDRVLTDGHEHEGIDLRFGGESHRIDFTDLVGEAVWLYP
jgi:p-hydroxybenzoate 3-monooxygenase